MGSPPAPHLANGWMSQYDQIIQGDAKLYDRYMDDILREIKRGDAEQKLTEINALEVFRIIRVIRIPNYSAPSRAYSELFGIAE